MHSRASGRSRIVAFVVLVLTGGLAFATLHDRPAEAAVTTVKGYACGYFVKVGLFGGPQNLRGCGQTAGGVTSASPAVTLPMSGSAAPLTATDTDGARAVYGPAVIFGGRWPEAAASGPPSGPMSVSTEGTPSGGTVTSSADIVLRTPADPLVPGGFGPGPVEGDELHATCTATETGVTGSVRFVNGVLSTTTDVEGAPLAHEAIPENPPPNYTRSGVLTNVGDVYTVVFNEQIVNADGSLTVNAFHMYLFGPVAVGESVGGQVTCGTTPTTVSPIDTVAPTCGIPVIEPVGPENPAPRVPRTERIGVFDAGGLQSISSIQITNGTVELGVPASNQNYLKFIPGQRGPLPITAVRTNEALAMTWSFDAKDAAGKTTHCQGIEPPRVSGLFPSAGPTAGGNQVVITGTGFTGATKVSFGTTQATPFTVDSDTQITTAAPAGAPGTVDVTIVTPRGSLVSPTGTGYTFSGQIPVTTTTTTTAPVTTTTAPNGTTTTQPSGSTTTTPPGTVTTTPGSSTGGSTGNPTSSGSISSGLGSAGATGSPESSGSSGSAGSSGSTASDSSASRGSLSKTGFSLRPYALVAALCLALGALLTMVTRRRRASAAGGRKISTLGTAISPRGILAVGLSLLSTTLLAWGCSSASKSAKSEEITAVIGKACGYYVNVGLFGGPQNLRGCGQPPNGPPVAVSPEVSLPPEGSVEPVTRNNGAGAKAQYGPAVIFGGIWPADVGTTPPSGPISVSTQGTPATKSVTASADIILRSPPDPKSPGGFGPSPVEGDELHVSCAADDKGVTGSTTFVKGILSTSTTAEGEPKDMEPIPDKPPVNYTRSGVITNVGDVFSVVFNEHIVNPDGSLTVNGAHMYLFGPTAIGEMVKGQVTCGTTPSRLSSDDKVAPSCGTLVVEPMGPEDPTPKSPRTELIGVFDAGGLESIDNVKATNGTVQIGNPSGAPYLQFKKGQTGPLQITASRTPEADAAGLPLSWSFDAKDKAGNTTHCPGPS